MAPKRLIRLTFPANTDGKLTHQVCNLGEDLYREIELAGLGDLGGLAAVDTATDMLLVTIKHRSMIGRVRGCVTKLVAKHLLADRTLVTFE